MASIQATAPDGNTLNIQVPEGTPPEHYDALVDHVMDDYHTSKTGEMPVDATGHAKGDSLAFERGPNYTSKSTDPAEQRVVEGLGDVAGGYGVGQLGGGLAKLATAAKAAPKIAAEAATEAPQAAKAAEGAAQSEPLKAVNDFISQKYGQASAKPGFGEKVADYLRHESLKLGAKDIGLQPRQVYSMGPGLEGPEKAEQLVQYAMDQGYLRPGLTDLARRDMFKGNVEKFGQQVGGIRGLADQRGAAIGKDEMLNAVRNALEKQYGKGAGINEAPGELERIYNEINVSDPTHQGWAGLATKINQFATPTNKMVQNPGAYTDAANTISRLNNEAIKTKLTPEELKLYEDSLRNFGAHKGLEKPLARGVARELAARTNQRGVMGKAVQEFLDRVGYRTGANVLNRVSQAVSKNPALAKDLPAFFEQLEHSAKDVLDDSVEGFQ